ncbi:MAG: hypothetical protein R6X34_17585 [Chloroflexota bacterium]
MKLLLDTHAFLWSIAGDSQLDSHARRLIEDFGNERYLSLDSICEITIKSSLGRLVVPTPPSALIREHVWANAIILLPIMPEHFDYTRYPRHDPATTIGRKQRSNPYLQVEVVNLFEG